MRLHTTRDEKLHAKAMQIEVEQTEAHAEVVEMMPMDIEAVGHALSSDAEDIKPGTINSFTFRDLGYTVVTPEGPRVVLQHVSGHLATKEMLAMMGPSGSGKTSLLNVLAARVQASRVTGEILINGSKPKKSFKQQLGFVFQDDLMLPNLTVKETIMYSARLRLPQSTTRSEVSRAVEKLLETLGLMKVENSRIGSIGKRGISGGERKRVAIGVELVTSPRVIFLDEPTSGLDSSTALSIMLLLRRLCSAGMLVICSIHQPRATIFSQFHKLLLLQSGQTVYFGAVAGCEQYFIEIGLEFPPRTNVADWLLDVVTADSEKQAAGEDSLSLVEEYNRSSQKARVDEQQTNLIATSHNCSNETDDEKRVWNTSSVHQFFVLLERSSIQQRGEVFNSVNIFQILSVAVLASAVWWQSRNIKDISGVFFFITIQQSFNTLNSVIRIFPNERNLMMRERSSGAYRVLPYFLAKSCSDMMSTTIFPIVYAVVIYWAVGLHPESNFFIFIGLFFSVIMTAQSIGLLLSVCVHDVTLASSMSFVITLLMMLFGGFYVSPTRIPIGVRWLKYLSFMYWVYGALLRDYFADENFPCSYAAGIDLSTTSCPIHGSEVLSRLGFGAVKLGESAAVLWGMTLAYRIMAYFFLRLNSRPKA